MPDLGSVNRDKPSSAAGGENGGVSAASVAANAAAAAVVGPNGGEPLGRQERLNSSGR